MTEQTLRELFESIRNGRCDVEQAIAKLRTMPFEDLGFAKVDHHRGVRCGFPEVIYAEGKTPEQVTSPEVFSYAHSIGLSGRKPSSVTIAARIACLSSFYRFLIRMSLVVSNPCDRLERPRATPAPPRGLAAADIQKLLAVIPVTPVGLRDRAIILTLTLTCFQT
ncbi:MAG: hypothetical protein IH805_04720 [Proteobacteria bacterium]|nr:hypothetical protein [Pseudomonadota bacterium]